MRSQEACTALDTIPPVAKRKGKKTKAFWTERGLRWRSDRGGWTEATEGIY